MLGAGALYGVVAIASDDAWAVGGIRRARNGKKAALILHWDGNRWRRAEDMGSIAPGTILYSVSASGPNVVWAAGRYQPKGAPARARAALRRPARARRPRRRRGAPVGRRAAEAGRARAGRLQLTT
jgi:hypothetical protein